ncbi:MAG: radical SAM protein, partial [Caldilineae bacterium]
PLDGEDIIYFSPFRPDPAAPYADIAKAEGIEMLDEDDARAQERAIRARLTQPMPPAGPKRVPYNLHDFVY